MQFGRGPRPQTEFFEKIVEINRVSKVVKGGKRLSFSALVVVGDGKGRVSVSLGKANEVAEAIRKGLAHARKSMITVSLKGTTIPHEIIGHFGASKVLLRPASDGTGVIAGGAVRAVLDACGIRNILTKSLGSANAINAAYATLTALNELKTEAGLAALRAEDAPASPQASAPPEAVTS